MMQSEVPRYRMTGLRCERCWFVTASVGQALWPIFGYYWILENISTDVRFVQTFSCSEQLGYSVCWCPLSRRMEPSGLCVVESLRSMPGFGILGSVHLLCLRPGRHRTYPGQLEDHVPCELFYSAPPPSCAVPTLHVRLSASPSPRRQMTHEINTYCN